MIQRFAYTMTNWIRVASVADCLPGQSLEVVAGDRVCALFNVDGTYYALDGICPHQGGPLGKGMLHGAVVTCPWHGWQFDVCSGRHCLSRTLIQQQFPVRVDDDSIFVDISS